MGVFANVLPVRRNLAFHLPKDLIGRWKGRHLHISQFFNTLSIFFPVGERFFIDSVRHYRDAITDPELKAAVAAFIGQEAMHSREHIELNNAMTAAGLPLEALEGQVINLLNWVRRHFGPDYQLAATTALEHLTALMADGLLLDERILKDAEPHYAALWRWHALEETEHKAVAYDVYLQVVGSDRDPRAYAKRIFAFVVANALFWPLVYKFYYQILRTEGAHRDLKGWFDSLYFMWGAPGPLRRMVPQWLDYFRPGFHPWQHDNRELLGWLDALVAEVESFEKAVAA